MEWHSPLWFLALIPVLAVALYVWFFWRKKRASMQFSQLSVFKSSAKGWRAYLVKGPLLLKFLALVFVVVSLARPQESDSKVKRNVEGIDIVVALDISDSMLIEDMKPENRLESAKQTIEQFVQQRVSDRIGLVLFSGESFTRVPITLDYKILLESLRQVETTRTVKMGTAIGVALANAVARLKDSTAKSRVVILLTDGENNSGTIDPATALDIAEGYGIRIYTIGMGRDGQAQIPIYYKDARGRKRKRYQPIHSKVNDELLGRLAQETGGKYYRATNTQALERVFTDINTLERTKIEVNQFVKYTELFQNYLFWGLCFFGLSLLAKYLILRVVP